MRALVRCCFFVALFAVGCSYSQQDEAGTSNEVETPSPVAAETTPTKPAKPKVVIDPAQEFQRVVEAVSNNVAVKRAWFEMNDANWSIAPAHVNENGTFVWDDGSGGASINLVNYDWNSERNSGTLYLKESGTTSPIYYRITLQGSDKGLSVAKLEECLGGKADDDKTPVTDLNYKIQISQYRPASKLREFWNLVLKKFTKQAK